MIGIELIIFIVVVVPGQSGANLNKWMDTDQLQH